MTFSSEQKVKAVRKPHRCDGCLKRLSVGDPAIRWAGMTDGEFGTAIYHVECRAAEIALNELHGTYSADDWQWIGDLDREDREWLLAEHPICAERLGVFPQVPA